LALTEINDGVPNSAFHLAEVSGHRLLPAEDIAAKTISTLLSIVNQASASALQS